MSAYSYYGFEPPSSFQPPDADYGGDLAEGMVHAGYGGDFTEGMVYPPVYSGAAFAEHAQYGYHGVNSTFPHQDSSLRSQTNRDGTLDAPLDSVPFDGAPIDGAPFSSAPFDSALFDSAPLNSTPFNGATFDSALFDSAPFESALFDSAPFDIAPSALDPQFFDCILENSLRSTGGDGYADCSGNTSLLTPTEHAHPRVAPSRTISADCFTQARLEQRSGPADAETHNSFQEAGRYVMPDSGVAYHRHTTVTTPASPSSSTSNPPTAPHEGNVAPPAKGQGRWSPVPRNKGQGRRSAPTSIIPCTRPGCTKKFSRQSDVSRHEYTTHNRRSWYCPGLDAAYVHGEEPCKCPPEGFSRHDQLLEHIINRGLTTPCYQGAIEYGWHPDTRGSIRNLKEYRPQWLRI